MKSWITETQSGIIDYSCLHWGHDRLCRAQQALDLDIKSSNIDLARVSNSVWILNFLSEGQSDEDIVPLLTALGRYTDLSHIRVMFNASVEISTLQYTALSDAWHMVNHQDWWQHMGKIHSDVHHKFLCLCRRPSLGRAKFQGGLMHRVKDVLASFGDNPNSSYPNLSVFYPCPLPLIIDGGTDVIAQHHMKDQRIHRCLFNVVIETSSQSDADSWNSIFVTEKSFKALAMHHIPIWWAVPGLVRQIRSMGFDVFDDIINHGYDLIQNESHRMQAVWQELQKLDNQYTLANCCELRSSLQRRFTQNRALIQQHLDPHGVRQADLRHGLIKSQH